MANLITNWFDRLSGKTSVSERSAYAGGPINLKDTNGLMRLFGLDGISARATAQSAMGISTFFGCVRLISNLTSSNPFGVYKELPEGGSEKAKKHPLNYLLTIRPNRQMTPIITIRTLVANCIVHGFSIARIVRDEKNQPISITPFPSQNVQPMEDPLTGFYFFQVYHNSETLYLSEDDVIFLKDLNFDGRTGESIVNWQRNTLKLDLLTSGFATKYYEKGTFIGGFLEAPIAASDKDSAKIYKQRVIDSLKGDEGGFGLAVLGPGIKWHPVSRTPLESQLMEVFNKASKDIAMMFGVPLSMLGDTEKQTSFGAGVEQMFIGFLQTVLTPIATQIEQEFNYKCFRIDEIQNGYYTKFNFNGLLRGDSAARAEFVSKMISNGTYNHDEVRALDEMPPLPNGLGKRHYVQGAMIPVDKIDEFLKSKSKQNGKGTKSSSAG